MANTYFDNGSTSWPKPQAVIRAVTECMENLQGNPGRTAGGKGPGLVGQTRAVVAKFFGISDPSRIVFTANATGAINLGIRGILKKGDRAVTSSMEHNAVSRPLIALKKDGIIDFEIVKTSHEGILDPADLKKALEKKTRLVVITHASNIAGSYNDIAALGKMAKDSGAIFMVDASQSAGVIPINVITDHIDILACPGHKSLLGPSGTGICYLSPELGEITPIIFGGTGSFSELDQMPDVLPDRFEAGTLNFQGLAGLKASVEYLTRRGLADVAKREKEIAKRMLAGLSTIKGIKLHGPKTEKKRLLVFSVTHPSIPLNTLGTMLFDDFGITTRVGLHCTPWGHDTFKTSPQGTLRLSPGLFQTDEDIDFGIDALKKCVLKADN